MIYDRTTRAVSLPDFVWARVEARAKMTGDSLDRALAELVTEGIGMERWPPDNRARSNPGA